MGDGADTESVIELEISSGEVVTVLSTEIEPSEADRKLIWYWYEIGSRATTNTYVAKIYQLLGLFDGRKDGTLIAVSADCGFSCAMAETNIENFLSEMYSGIRSSL